MVLGARVNETCVVPHPEGCDDALFKLWMREDTIPNAMSSVQRAFLNCH